MILNIQLSDEQSMVLGLAALHAVTVIIPPNEAGNPILAAKVKLDLERYLQSGRVSPMELRDLGIKLMEYATNG